MFNLRWLLLNQLSVNLELEDCKTSVLEEVVSSEAQLVQVLVSGHISLETMNSVYPEGVLSNLVERKGHRL